MIEELRSQRQPPVQPPIQPVVVDRFDSDPKKVFEGRLCIPALAQCQFRGLLAEASHAQNRGHLLPAHRFASGRQMLADVPHNALTRTLGRA